MERRDGSGEVSQEVACQGAVLEGPGRWEMAKVPHMRHGSSLLCRKGLVGCDAWEKAGILLPSSSFGRWPACLMSFLVALIVAGSPANAEVKLPPLFSDNMVLQRGKKVALWGIADPGEQVTVTLSDQKVIGSANSARRWQVAFGPLKAGGPWEMAVAGSNTLTLHNVVVGEVWVDSGQSNMQMPIAPHPARTSNCSWPPRPPFSPFPPPTARASFLAPNTPHNKWKYSRPEPLPNYRNTERYDFRKSPDFGGFFALRRAVSRD